MQGLLLICLLVIIGQYPHPVSIYSSQIEVLDGDTVVLKNGEKVRLAHIDAPELGQKPFGELSRNYLKSLVVGKRVKIKLYSKGYYGRWIGELFYDGESLNLKMLKEGYAIVYQKARYLSLWQKNQYEQAYTQMILRAKGLLELGPYENPYYWRKVRHLRKMKKSR